MFKLEKKGVTQTLFIIALGSGIGFLITGVPPLGALCSLAAVSASYLDWSARQEKKL